jgi:hypothetical protein
LFVEKKQKLEDRRERRREGERGERERDRDRERRRRERQRDRDLILNANERSFRIIYSELYFSISYSILKNSYIPRHTYALMITKTSQRRNH